MMRRHYIIHELYIESVLNIIHNPIIRKLKNLIETHVMHRKCQLLVINTLVYNNLKNSNMKKHNMKFLKIIYDNMLTFDNKCINYVLEYTWFGLLWIII